MRHLTRWLGMAGLLSPVSVALAEICVSSACGHMETFQKIPDAENSIFTSAGPYFTGGQGFYRVRSSWSGSGLTAEQVGPTGNYTGMAEANGVLYVLAYNGTLHAHGLTPASNLVPIHQLSGVAAANGMVAGPGGELYIVNGPVPTNGSLPTPKIVRVKIDPDDPYHVIEQTTWLTGDVLMFPNGLTRKGNTLYLTDHNSAKIAIGWIAAVDILVDGSAGALRHIAHFPSIPDDLSLAGDDFIVAEYSSGTVARFGPDGKFISQLRLGSIPGASSVRVAQPPLGTANDLLITRKGVIGVNDGDAVLLWRRN